MYIKNKHYICFQRDWSVFSVSIQIFNPGNFRDKHCFAQTLALGSGCYNCGP